MYAYRSLDTHAYTRKQVKYIYAWGGTMRSGVRMLDRKYLYWWTPFWYVSKWFIQFVCASAKSKIQIQKTKTLLLETDNVTFPYYTILLPVICHALFVKFGKIFVQAFSQFLMCGFSIRKSSIFGKREGFALCVFVWREWKSYVCTDRKQDLIPTLNSASGL